MGMRKNESSAANEWFSICLPPTEFYCIDSNRYAMNAASKRKCWFFLFKCLPKYVHTARCLPLYFSCLFLAVSDKNKKKH